MNHNKLYITLLCLLFTAVCSAQPVIDKIAAVVDDKIVLQSDIESELEQYKQQGMKSHADTMRCGILEGLLTQKLLLAQALLDSVQVSDDEVENELDRRVRYFSSMAGGTQKLEEYYGKSIIQIKEEFRIEIKQQMLAQRKQGEIINSVKVTPNEVRSYFNSIPKDSLPYYNSEVELGVIIINPKVSPDIKQLTKEKVIEFRNRILKGESFATLAKAYSEDPSSAEQGGELGFFNRGEMDPAFEAASYSLKKPDEISDVIESKFGFHIIQLIERRGERINVRHILVMPKTTSYDLAKAQAIADSAYKLIIDKKMTFDAAAAKFSEDEDTKNNGGTLINPNTNNSYFEINQLGQSDAALALEIQKLEAGGVNAPVTFKTPTGKIAYRIVKLKSKSSPHQANLQEDYDKLQALALQVKQAKVFNEWLDGKIKKTYIRINSSYLTNCSKLKKWNTAQ